VTIGPDAARYLLAAQGIPQASPFHMRPLWPFLLGDSVPRWRMVRLACFPLIVALTATWRLLAGDPWGVALAAGLLLVLLPGVQGPDAVNPVGVDLPTMVLGLGAVVLIELGHPAQIVAAVVLTGLTASGKESAPVWVALWAWNPWALLAFAAVAVAFLVRRPQMDPITEQTPVLKRVHDRPITSSMEHHRGQWRNAWFMVAPWGVTLAALVDPSPRLAVVVAAAYAQLVIATDTVRIYQAAAGPVVALAAAQAIPVQWLALAVAVHVVWWREPVLC
jgi:hypothetical protein